MTQEQSIRLTIKALMEVVDSGSKNMEIAVMVHGSPVKILEEAELDRIIKDIERELEEAKKQTQDQEASLE